MLIFIYHLQRGRNVKEVSIRAYAKINLYLDVVSKLNNGFHGIESVMQTVSLADEVTVSARDAQSTEIKVICDSHFAPDGEENIAYRAAKIYLDRAGVNASVVVKIRKNIPSPAGMGGGSADAAAVLRGLDLIFERFDISELEELASHVGSDVPFCIKGGTQISEGRGELLASCPDMPKCYFVIGCGKDLLSTPEAYRMLDERYGGFSEWRAESGLGKFIDSLSSIEDTSRALYNVFESVTVPVCPSVAVIKNILSDSGALGTLMCGSGPAVFGIFTDEETASKAASNVEKAGFFSSVCTLIQNY